MYLLFFLCICIFFVIFCRTKTSFPLPSQSTNNSSSASFEATNSCLSSNTLINRYTVFDNYSEDATLEGLYHLKDKILF